VSATRVRSDGDGAFSNQSTRLFASILGAVAGAGGVLHGFYEVLQGSVPSDDILSRIGAFTLIPNYLYTGICAIAVGTAVIVWSAAFVHRSHGPLVYASLAFLLFLVGGGVALVPGSILVWGVATRIAGQLSWWNKLLSSDVRAFLGRIWLPTFVIGMALFLTGFSIWTFIVPPGEVRKVTAIHYVLWSCLTGGLLFLLLAIPCGFARDIERRRGPPG